MRPSLALAGAVLALCPAAASAATISYQGDTLVLTAGAGETNSITFGGVEPGKLSISDDNPYSLPAGRCTQEDPSYSIQCDQPSAIRVDLGDRNDTAVVDHMVQGNPAIEIRGGAGNDNLKAIEGNTRLTLDGGAGADILRSEGGDDVLRGGPDGDELIGGAGSDVLEGGDGADKLSGDVCGTPAADVLDGGPGVDTLTDWGDCGPDSDRRPVTVTVNGKADDGRPGEGDNVRDLDVLRLFVPATVVGGDGDEVIEIYAAGDAAPSSIQGRGGNDDLRGGLGRETIDGGAGNDRIEGGFNHDTLTGGPGRDVIYGDSTSGNCGGYGQSCVIPFGNDKIDARDGEADQVDCGAGEDTALVDTVDTVADNCESVQRSSGASPAVASLRISAATRRGLTVQLDGFASATTVRVRGAGKLLGSRRVSGNATVRVRFSAKARRSLARRRSVRLVVSAGSLKKTVTVTR